MTTTETILHVTTASMNDTFAACDDAAFGPIVSGCRGNFDFTVAFEFYFFSLPPLTIVLLAVPLRVVFLRRFHAKLVAGGFKYLKLVSSSCHSVSF